VKLLAVLVGDYGTAGSSCICNPSLDISTQYSKCLRSRTGSNHYPSIEGAPYDSSTGRSSFRKRHSLGVQRRIAGIVGEIETRHYDELYELMGIDGGIRDLKRLMMDVMVLGDASVSS
jgi:hypothetical protein